jgi:hypothetical protein
MTQIFYQAGSVVVSRYHNLCRVHGSHKGLGEIHFGKLH